MSKKEITVTCVYGKENSARKLIEQSFLRYLKNTLVCKKI